MKREEMLVMLFRDINREIRQRRRRRQQERQKTIGSEIGKTTTCITLFSTFLRRRCMTTT